MQHGFAMSIRRSRINFEFGSASAPTRHDECRVVQIIPNRPILESQAEHIPAVRVAIGDCPRKIRTPGSPLSAGSGDERRDPLRQGLRPISGVRTERGLGNDAVQMVQSGDAPPGL